MRRGILRILGLLGLVAASFGTPAALARQDVPGAIDRDPLPTLPPRRPSPQTPARPSSQSPTGTPGEAPGAPGGGTAQSSPEPGGAGNPATGAPGGPTPEAAPNAPGAGAGATPPGAAAAGAGGGVESAGLGGFASAASSAFNMIGDQPPVLTIRASQPPPVPGPGGGVRVPPNVARSSITPSVRGIKITENQSPIPQDRVFVDFNSFYNVNKSLNNHFQSPIDNVTIWREIFGFEKTFADGLGSFGLRIPLDTIHATQRQTISTNLNTGGQFTAPGNLAIFGKYTLWRDPEAGHWVTAGFSITPPTGTNQFAGAPYLVPSRSTSLSPFLGYYFRFDRVFVHGFTSLDAPTNYNLPTYFYNDLGVGYFLFQSAETDRLLTALVPTFEAHVNTPLNHRNPYSLTDLFGAPDVVNLTGGMNFELFGSTVLTVAAVTPVTGPRPFDVEGVVLLNVRFGRGSRIFPTIGQ